MNNANILMLNIWHDECVSHSYSCNPCNNSRGIYNYTYFVRAHTCDKLLSRVRLFATPWTACRLRCLWDVPGKNTGVGCHFLLQAIFPTQGSNLSLLCLLHCRRILYHCATREDLTPISLRPNKHLGSLPCLKSYTCLIFLKEEGNINQWQMGGFSVNGSPWIVCLWGEKWILTDRISYTPKNFRRTINLNVWYKTVTFLGKKKNTLEKHTGSKDWWLIDIKCFLGMTEMF